MAVLLLRAGGPESHRISGCGVQRPVCETPLPRLPSLVSPVLIHIETAHTDRIRWVDAVGELALVPLCRRAQRILRVTIGTVATRPRPLGHPTRLFVSEPGGLASLLTQPLEKGPKI
eukprot:3774605-Pleurochrysis_carterae.AAC.1